MLDVRQKKKKEKQQSILQYGGMLENDKFGYRSVKSNKNNLSYGSMVRF